MVLTPIAETLKFMSLNGNFSEGRTDTGTNKKVLTKDGEVDNPSVDAIRPNCKPYSVVDVLRSAVLVITDEVLI